MFRWQVSWLADRTQLVSLPRCDPSGDLTNGFPLTVAGAAAELGRTPHGIPFSPSSRMDHRERAKQEAVGCQSAVAHHSLRSRWQNLYLAPTRTVRGSNGGRGAGGASGSVRPTGRGDAVWLLASGSNVGSWPKRLTERSAAGEVVMKPIVIRSPGRMDRSPDASTQD